MRLPAGRLWCGFRRGTVERVDELARSRRKAAWIALFILISAMVLDSSAAYRRPPQPIGISWASRMLLPDGSRKPQSMP